jgi:hypothetical protein
MEISNKVELLVQFTKQDITTMPVAVIVNSANPWLGGIGPDLPEGVGAADSLSRIFPKGRRCARLCLPWTPRSSSCTELGLDRSGLRTGSVLLSLAFSTASRRCKSGQVSDTPVKSDFGWHVIKVEDRRPATPGHLRSGQRPVEIELGSGAGHCGDQASSVRCEGRALPGRRFARQAGRARFPARSKGGQQFGACKIGSVSLEYLRKMRCP